MRTISCWLALFAALFAGVAGAAAVQLQDVRMWTGTDRTRVILDLDSKFHYDLFTLDGPARVVIDIRNADTAAGVAESLPGEGLVKRIRTGVHDDFVRVVLDLARDIQPRSASLAPKGEHGYRLVVDLKGRVKDALASTVAGAEADEEKASHSAPASKQANRQPVVQQADFVPEELVVAVDAGHGGQDPGAIGPHGTMEKDVVLQIARRLAAKIDAQPGMRAVMTRAGDYFLTLRERIKKAQKAHADLFVSIHANAARVGMAEGSSVYVLSREGATSEHARWLAHRENSADLLGGVSLEHKDRDLASFMLDLAQGASIEASLDVGQRVLEQLSKINDLHKHTVQQAAFVVLKSPDIPSLLVETAFITNPVEVRQLQSAEFQRKLAAAVFRGIRGYFASYRPMGPLVAQREHQVRRGETLSGIALQYGVSTAAIRRANSLDSSVIRVGQVLVIPYPSRTRVAAIDY